MSYPAGMVAVPSPDTNGLFAGPCSVVTATVNLKAGVSLLAGALLGMVTASGEYVLAAADATDGSAEPQAILSHDVGPDDTAAVVYLSGWFNPDRLTFGDGHSADATRKALRGLGLYLA